MSTDARPSRSVLVVDDNRDAVTLLSRVLRRWGHTVYTAHDGPEAVEQVKGHRPDIVLLDIALPRMNGYEVAERLASLDPPFQGSLVALTGYATEDAARRARVEFAHHLLKPVDLEALDGLLKDLE